MKLKPILTATALALAALVQPVLASNYTYDKNGEPTHYKGIPLPPIQTVAEGSSGFLVGWVEGTRGGLG